MDGNYTTLLKQQRQDLSDEYYLSCVDSSEGDAREFSLAGTVTKIVLVTTLTVGAGSYSAHSKEPEPSQKNIPALVSDLSGCNKGSQKFSSVVDNGNIALEVNRAAFYQQTRAKDREANYKRMESFRRREMLMDSFVKNRSSDCIPNSSRMTMQRASQLLCSLPFNDSILQYDKYDDAWHYNLFFNKDVELSVSVYVEGDMLDDADYSIYHEGELLVANTLPLNQLVRKMKVVMAKVQKNA